MSRTRYTPGQRASAAAYARMPRESIVCEHLWERRPWDVFPHHCAKCGAWSNREIPPPVGRKREVDRQIPPDSAS